MSHAIWTGSISFGLVTIPVKLLPAVRADEEVHFHFLHAKDRGRIKNVRKCEVCGKDIPWKETVRGFEHEKGSFVVVDDDELKRLRPEATQAVEIQAFVAREEIDPMLFDMPYYLEPQAKGQRAYALLRDALANADKVGIAQVILRTRAHLAVLSPHGAALVLELLHYPHEIVPAGEMHLPPAKSKAAPAEMKAAAMLIEAMVKPFDLGEYKDDYEERLRTMLEARARGEAPKRTKANEASEIGATNVVDLAEVLQRSLAQRSAKSSHSTKRPQATRHRAAAEKA
jgi:DNA end-binding protein Ku